MVRTAKLNLALLALVIAPPCLAGEGSFDTHFVESDSTGLNGKISAQPSQLNATRRAVSSRVGALAGWVDSFFNDPNFSDEEAQGRLELRQQLKISKDSLADFGTGLNGRLSLPNMSRRWNLIFEGNKNLATEETDEKQSDEEPETSADRPSVGVEYFHDMKNELSTSISGGVRLDTPSVYIGPRYRVQADLSEHWLGRFTQRIRWDTHDGWETISKLDFDRQLGRDKLFRQSFSAVWREHGQAGEEVRYTINSAVTQPLAEKTAIRYTWSSSYFTRPTVGWRSSVVSVSHRRLAWRDWAFLEIGPFLSWEDELDWEVNPGVRIALDVIFEQERSTSRP